MQLVEKRIHVTIHCSLLLIEPSMPHVVSNKINSKSDIWPQIRFQRNCQQSRWEIRQSILENILLKTILAMLHHQIIIHHCLTCPTVFQPDLGQLPTTQELNNQQNMYVINMCKIVQFINACASNDGIVEQNTIPLTGFANFISVL